MLRMESAGLDALVDADFPELEGELVGDQLTAAGVFEESAPERSREIERPEDVAASAVEIARNSAERTALRALAAAGCAEDQVSLVFAHGLSRTGWPVRADS